ncbi:MAG TPA: alpha-D-ribose 1-methylphosphonate 5-triphosphate diphosphatase [Dehalococcoidia bacterium]|nr:alpha-D-ribose 1-methylphosphonate 5-triphosphate diphosphatase [Dehalococcoidia bacterium]
MSDNQTKSLAITNAIVVLPNSVLDRGAVGISDGRIAEVVSSSEPLVGRYEEWLDARGAYLMPGIIDVHNDGLEVEVNPRPETNLPVEMALANMEMRLLASGVTTEFHAIAFMDNERSKRTLDGAVKKAALLAEYVSHGTQLVDNQILHRLDVWSPQSLDSIFESLDRMSVKYISINDHTPGQGQYRNLDGFKERMQAWAERRGGVHGLDTIEQRMSDRAADTETIPMVYGRILDEMQRSPFTIASHDDDSPEKVDTLWQLGARVSEFPVDVDTARRARERGMTIVVGAPNIVRGGSSSGNQDASELFSLGLADAICADYHAPSLLPSAFRLVDEGIVDLPAAVRSLGYNAAKALRLEGLGAIETGCIADVILVRREGRGIPLVERVLRGGREIMALRAASRVEVTV